MVVYGIRLIGVDAHNGEKVLFTLVLVAGFYLVRLLLNGASSALFAHVHLLRVRFWARQAINVITTLVLLLGLISIWFDTTKNLASVLGLASAGIAFALQKVITSFAGYLVILRGKTFNVGDRVVMGGVRGDVLELGFMQTTIMEMGEPPPVQNAPPAVWVEGRQFTGRIVRVSNAVIFDEPVYNYSHEFPLIWEEMRIPIAYTDDRHRAESILLDVARTHTQEYVARADGALREMFRRYPLVDTATEPRVFWRITDNWVELAVRFLSPPHGARVLKDAMSREILAAFDAAHIGIASSTYDIVGFPEIRVAPQRDPKTP